MRQPVNENSRMVGVGCAKVKQNVLMRAPYPLTFSPAEADERNVIRLALTGSMPFQDLDDAPTECPRGTDPFLESGANGLLLDVVVLIIALVRDAVAVKQNAISRLALNLAPAVRETFLYPQRQANGAPRVRS